MRVSLSNYEYFWYPNKTESTFYQKNLNREKNLYFQHWSVQIFENNIPKFTETINYSPYYWTWTHDFGLAGRKDELATLDMILLWIMIFMRSPSRSGSVQFPSASISMNSFVLTLGGWRTILRLFFCIIRNICQNSKHHCH